ncbi:cysteine hydrolase [Candidatus Woesearchaeota archaeon]|nr:cysteine hydrolase [Candidatus Woesearchaeota archaeon]
MEKKYCLTIIDMQEDFVSSEGYYANKSHEMAPINKITRKIKNFLPTLNEKYPIIYVISEFKDKQFGDNKTICVKGSKGCNLILDRKFASKVILKNDLSAFSNKEYANFLNRNEIKSVIIMGVLTEYCVKETVLDALNEGFEVIVIEDCIATGGDEKENRINTIKELKEKGAIFQTLQNLLADSN